MNKQELQDRIDQLIYENSVGGVTPTNLNDVLSDIVEFSDFGLYSVSKLNTVNQNNLQNLINSIGNIPSKIIIDVSIEISSNITIPSNIELDWMPTAILNILSGVTITINSPINKKRTTIIFW